MAVVVLLLNALVMIAGGLYAFTSAPPEASRATAIIVPGACAVVMLVLAALIFRARFSPTLIIVAGVVTLLFALVILFPARARGRALENFPAAAAAWAEATKADPSLAERAAADRTVRRGFFRERNSPDHDQAYLVRTLWTLSVSNFVSTALLFAAAGLARRTPRAGQA
jgi:hypothetical protein